MSALFKCEGCGTTASFGSRNSAAEHGWSFAELLDKQRVTYHVFCRTCQPPWMKAAFGDDKPRKEKK